jgi:hypothetical protein
MEYTVIPKGFFELHRGRWCQHGKNGIKIQQWHTGHFCNNVIRCQCCKSDPTLTSFHTVAKLFNNDFHSHLAQTCSNSVMKDATDRHTHRPIMCSSFTLNFNGHLNWVIREWSVKQYRTQPAKDTVLKRARVNMVLCLWVLWKVGIAWPALRLLVYQDGFCWTKSVRVCEW